MPECDSIQTEYTQTSCSGLELVRESGKPDTCTPYACRATYQKQRQKYRILLYFVGMVGEMAKTSERPDTLIDDVLQDGTARERQLVNWGLDLEKRKPSRPFQILGDILAIFAVSLLILGAANLVVATLRSIF
jgi:hypothetical protein